MSEPTDRLINDDSQTTMALHSRKALPGDYGTGAGHGAGVKRPVMHEPHMEDSPSYQVLRDHDLLVSQYRLRDHTQIKALPANSTPLRNALYNLLACAFFPVGPIVKGCLCSAAEVPEGHVRALEDGRGGFDFIGQGVHLIMSPFYRIGSTNESFAHGHIVNGDATIVVVDQGCIGYATDRGQPVLLPPGLHQWRSPTLQYQRSYSLDHSVIVIGPYTILTVDEGYSAVTQNNGKQEILAGGQVHLLTHKNWKFEKFMTLKIQTNDLQRIEVITADNVLMLIDATVNWKIVDVATAARLAAETMHKRGGQEGASSAREHDMDISKLRNDVLKQAAASLSSFIGTVNYSDTFSAAAQVQSKPHLPQPGHPVDPPTNSGPSGGASAANHYLDNEPVSSLFDVQRMLGCVHHANDVTGTYGVEIISINIIQMKPSESKLMNSLAQGAVAAAEAQQLETTARGRAKAARIEAQGDAEAELIRADASKKSAAMLEESTLACDIERIRATGQALSDRATLFFGASPGSINSLLSNPAVVGSGN